jgi:membrane peptidoglycan carboxypeptidase
MRVIRRHRRPVTAVVAALVLLGSGALAAAQALGLDRLPSVASVMDSGLPNDTLVYDRTGTVLLADLQQPGSQHTDVTLPAMGRWLPAATVAIDDPGFWSEPGVDSGRLLRAGWDGARGQAGGETGSTIVLRLIRLRLGMAYGVTARAQALALAVRVAGAVPKAAILQSYLNSLPYGSGAVGVEAAAITYFQVDAGQLDLAQASLLAGLPAAPNQLNPLRNLAAAKQRQRRVLDAMVSTHAASRVQADQAFAEPLRLVGPAPLNVAPDLVDSMVAELTTRYGSAALTNGLVVRTTLDWGLQQQAGNDLMSAVAAARFRGATSGALVATDPRTGEILALVTASDTQLRFATGPPARSPGSAFRAFTYAAAIASRQYTMVTPIDDSPVSIDLKAGGPAYVPRNYDLRSHGTCELRSCLGDGLNVPAVRVELGTGVPAVVGVARALGAPPYQSHFDANGTQQYTTNDPLDSFGPSLTLGGYLETPLQMATGLGTLAAAGVLHRPEAILRISAPDGRVLFRSSPGPGTQVFDPGAAFVVSQMLADDASRAQMYGQGSALVLPNRRVAALTGTAEQFSDGWAMGYTPSLAAVVWLGSADNRLMTQGSDGIFVAAPAWHRFMQSGLDQLGRGDEWYAAPAGVRAATVNGRQAWFLPGTSDATTAPPLPPNAHAVTPP